MEREDRSNPNAKIGFLISYPFQYYVYKNVYKALGGRAEFIVDMGLLFPRRLPDEVIASVVALLKKEGAYFRTLRYEDYYFSAYMGRFFRHYEALVCNWSWRRGCLRRSELDDMLKIQITYGAGKDLNQFDLRKADYDLILAYGEHDHAFYSQITNSAIVGNPKFDDWFNGTLDESQIVEVKARLDRSKKTVLYLPTHSDLSSIETLAPHIKALSATYNVIVKLHYYTPRDEPHLVDKLRHPDLVLLMDDTDLLPVLSLCDIVVSDNSSAIFDAMLADKLVVVTNFHDDGYFDNEHRDFRYYPRGRGGPLTYSDSIEQRIKRDGSVDTIDTAADLPRIIEKVIANDEKKEKRRALSRSLFSFRDGASGARAARAIEHHVAAPERARPLLYHLLEHYKHVVGKPSYVRERELNRSIRFYRSLAQKKVLSTDGIFFSIVLFSEGGTFEEWELSLRSIAEQEFPRSRYEVIVVGADADALDVVKERVVRTGAAVPTMIVSDADKSERSLGARLREAVSMAKGDVVCFTSLSCRVSRQWLLHLYRAYEQYADVAGVGGYVQSADKNPYVNFSIREIAAKLGVEREPRMRTRFYSVANRSFNQNPMGDLRNVSYLKEVAATIPTECNDAQSVKVYLKITAMRDRAVCFVPDFVSMVASYGLRDLWREQRRLGSAEQRWKHLIARNDTFLYPTVGSVLGKSAGLLRVRGFRRGFLALVAEFARLTGHVKTTFSRTGREAA